MHDLYDFAWDLHDFHVFHDSHMYFLDLIYVRESHIFFMIFIIFGCPYGWSVTRGTCRTIAQNTWKHFAAKAAVDMVARVWRASSFFKFGRSSPNNICCCFCCLTKTAQLLCTTYVVYGRCASGSRIVCTNSFEFIERLRNSLAFRRILILKY